MTAPATDELDELESKYTVRLNELLEEVNKVGKT